MSEEEFYTRVIVHGVIPAESADAAVAILCEKIRDGIGQVEPREGAIAIAMAAATHESDSDGIALVNNEFLKRTLSHDAGKEL